MPSIENEDNILQTLFGYFATFVRPYLWLYPTAVILFLAGGILYLRTATPIYSSTAEMMIASNEMRALDVKGIADPSYGMAGEAFIKTQIQVIHFCRQIWAIIKGDRGGYIEQFLFFISRGYLRTGEFSHIVSLFGAFGGYVL